MMMKESNADVTTSDKKCAPNTILAAATNPARISNARRPLGQKAANARAAQKAVWLCPEGKE